MDGCVLLTWTPSCVVSPRGETTHSGVDVNNTHPSMINPLNKIHNCNTCVNINNGYKILQSVELYIHENAFENAV